MRVTGRCECQPFVDDLADTWVGVLFADVLDARVVGRKAGDDQQDERLRLHLIPIAVHHECFEGIVRLGGTVGNMKALFAQKALYSASPILPQAAFPALPARGGAAGRLVGRVHFNQTSLSVRGDSPLAFAKHIARISSKATCGTMAFPSPRSLCD